MTAMTPFHVATIVTTRGIRGEVSATCPSGEPERLAKVRQVLLGSRDGKGDMEQVKVVGNWVHKGRWILRFADVTSMTAAEAFVGREVYLSEQDLPLLPENHVYTYQVVGARVVHRDGRLLGTVRDTERGAAHDFLVVERCNGEEALVPMTRHIVLNLDAAAGVVTVDPPEGLLEGQPEVVA